MDSGTMVMVSIDSHYILEACDNGVASSWHQSTHASYRTLNAAEPIRTGFDMDSHYIIDGYHASYRVQTNHSPNAAAAIPMRRGSETGYRHISHPPSMLYHPDAAFTQRRGFGTGYGHISHPPSMLHHPNASFTMRRRGFRTGYRHISHPPPMLHHPNASFTMRRRGFRTGYRHISHPPSMLYHPPSIIGHQTLPPTGFHQLDDVALLNNHINNVRIGTGNTSYEEFLALAERVGNVSTGLSDEFITAHMKTKDYIGTGDTEDNDCCVICQDEYTTQEKVGVLQCGHEYHASCLRKWLQMKNVCPMCKSEALSGQ